MISTTLANILRSGRSDFNARFAETRVRFPSINAETFSVLLEELVDPVALAVDEIEQGGAGEAVSAAYDVALELAGQNLAGPEARSLVISDGWQKIIPAAARHLAESPRTVLPAVSNALHNLARTGGASPERWVDGMCRMSGDCASATEFLKSGQLLAWRCGMAHYRPAALRLLEELPESVAILCLNLPENNQPHPPPGLPLEGGGTDNQKTASRLQTILLRLSRDPWYNPAVDDALQSGLRLMKRCGAFRGFGGLFPEPPQVAAEGGSIFVRSNGECWLLTADCFGATFHHCDPALFDMARSGLPDGFKLGRETVSCGGMTIGLGFPAAISSAAVAGNTMAMTSLHSHAVILAALS